MNLLIIGIRIGSKKDLIIGYRYRLNFSDRASLV